MPNVASEACGPSFELYVRVTEDADMQRFYHMIFAELLPVASLALRLTRTLHARTRASCIAAAAPLADSPAVKIYLYSPSRKWGSNPLHGFYSDLSAYSALDSKERARFAVELVDDDGEDAGGRAAAAFAAAPSSLSSLFALSSPSWQALLTAAPLMSSSLFLDNGGQRTAVVAFPGLVSLPRWDYEWFGGDQTLAFEAGRFIESLSRRALSLPQRPSKDFINDSHLENNGSSAEESGLIFQVILGQRTNCLEGLLQPLFSFEERCPFFARVDVHFFLTALCTRCGRRIRRLRLTTSSSSQT